MFLGVSAVLFLSYYLFPFDISNGAFATLERMRRTARAYKAITAKDYFLEREYWNYEKIVAAKKKFKAQLLDPTSVVHESARTGHYTQYDLTPDRTYWAYRVFYWFL